MPEFYQHKWMTENETIQLDTHLDTLPTTIVFFIKSREVSSPARSAFRCSVLWEPVILEVS